MRRAYAALRDFTDEACQGSVDRSRVWPWIVASGFAVAAVIVQTTASRADEDGISFWIPGLFGSMAAAPQQPGWAVTSFYYHDDVSGGRNEALAREITIGQFNPKTDVNVSGNVHALVDLGVVIPTYVFATPFLGGQASAQLVVGYANNNTNLNATGTATVDGLPPFTKSVALQQDTTGFSDLIPMFTDRWNAGVNNYMVYLTGDIPVGLYHSQNIANIGIGHGAIDGGAGYTYFDPKTGHEFSFVTGLTGNFENTSTNYTNGIDWHLDWGLSQFLTKQVQIGLVGYFYDQITPDQGCAPQLCPFESRVIGVGPQFGYIIPISHDWQGYIPESLRGVRPCQPSGRLERLANLRDFAGSADAG